MPTIKGFYKFEEISFRFIDKGKLNLSNLNFEIKQGEFVAIVGQSGSGNQPLQNYYQDYMNLLRVN